MSKFFENKNLFLDFSLKWFLCEGCLKMKFYPNRFLNVRFLYAGFYSILLVCFLDVSLNVILNSSLFILSLSAQYFGYFSIVTWLLD